MNTNIYMATVQNNSQVADNGEIKAASHGYNTASATALITGDNIAALTETASEAEIDYRNGLRHHGGRRPVPEDFEDIFIPKRTYRIPSLVRFVLNLVR